MTTERTPVVMTEHWHEGHDGRPCVSEDCPARDALSRALAERDAAVGLSMAAYEFFAKWPFHPDDHASDFTSSIIGQLEARLSHPPAEATRQQKRDEALRDFADHGTRHDTSPTIGGRIREPSDVGGWYGYIKSMDDGVRSRARAALTEPTEENDG